MVAIDDAEVLEGTLPPGKLRLVVAWIEIHRDELLANWNLAVTGQYPAKIDSLRWDMHPRVRRVVAKEDYTLETEFANGEVGLYDCEPLLNFGVFQVAGRQLPQESTPGGGTIVWPNEQDTCPDTLYEDSKKLVSGKRS